MDRVNRLDTKNQKLRKKMQHRETNRWKEIENNP